MTMTPKGQIERTGVISFHDAKISIWEDSIPSTNGTDAFKKRDDWEREFKRQVFARVIQTLNRLGWTVAPWDSKDYRCLAPSRRTCRKGDLHGELSINGRVVDFEMWQDVTPSQNPSGGRYDFDKEERMPYVLRLEVERTRRRIRDYLCNVFSGYTMSTRRSSKRESGETAMESITRNWAENNRSTPDKWEESTIKKTKEDVYHSTSRDGVRLEHGQKVYTTDHKGRWLVGHAYNSGGMWDVVTGPYYYVRKSNTELTTTPPPDLRVKRNQHDARKRLEQELQKAVQAMDFKRAQVLKGILFPAGPLYAIWSKKNSCYFSIMYCGYRNSLTDAGKYTRAELKPYLGDKLETDDLKAVPVA